MVEVVLGSYNTNYSPVRAAGLNFNRSKDRLFVVGNGVNASNRSDALTVLKKLLKQKLSNKLRIDISQLKVLTACICKRFFYNE